MDLVGDLVGTVAAPGAPVMLSSESSCRRACCDTPSCDGYTFAAGDASLGAGGTGIANCYLYRNITQLVPSSLVASGVLLSTL